VTDAYMGIDQSFGGFAIVVWVPEWQKADYDLKAYPAKNYGSGVDRLKAVTEHIVDVTHDIHKKDLDVKHICMEGYARNSRFRREEAGELGATVKLTLTAAFGKPISYPTIVAPTQLKQYVTGTAKASKDDMKRGVHSKWGELYFNDNLADAYGLARMAEAVATGQTNPGNPYEAEVVARLNGHTEMPAAA
jgi:Holliday junction resolvasome RuvABC endonuclease subunit